MKLRKGRFFLLPFCLLLLLCAACGGQEPEQTSQQAVIDGQNAEITFNAQNAGVGTVETEQGTYAFAWEGADQLSITYPDGSIYTWDGMSGSGTTGEEYIDGLSLAWALESAYRQNKPSSGGGASMLLAVLPLAIGVWFLWSPQSAWWLGHGWRYKDAEPSELALGMYRAGGVLLLLFGVICFLAAL